MTVALIELSVQWEKQALNEYMQKSTSFETGICVIRGKYRVQSAKEYKQGSLILIRVKEVDMTFISRPKGRIGVV